MVIPWNFLRTMKICQMESTKNILLKTHNDFVMKILSTSYQDLCREMSRNLKVYIEDYVWALGPVFL